MDTNSTIIEQRQQKLSDQVYRALVEKIIVGELAIGATISELALAKGLGVSRTPVHDAVNSLIKDGLVEQTGNRRPYVAQFTGAKIRDLFAMRRLLESEATRLAAPLLDRSTVAALRAASESLHREQSQEALRRRWVDFDHLFHSKIADNCGNRYLKTDVTRYRFIHNMLNRLYACEGTVMRGLEEHDAILAALEQRDGDTAARLMAAHIQEWAGFFANAVDRCSPKNRSPRQRS